MARHPTSGRFKKGKDKRGKKKGKKKGNPFGGKKAPPFKKK